MQYIYLMSNDYFIALRLLFHISEDLMEFLIMFQLKFAWNWKVWSSFLYCGVYLRETLSQRRSLIMITGLREHMNFKKIMMCMDESFIINSAIFHKKLEYTLKNRHLWFHEETLPSMKTFLCTEGSWKKWFFKNWKKSLGNPKWFVWHFYF